MTVLTAYSVDRQDKTSCQSSAGDLQGIGRGHGRACMYEYVALWQEERPQVGACDGQVCSDS